MDRSEIYVIIWGIKVYLLPKRTYVMERFCEILVVDCFCKISPSWMLECAINAVT